MAPGTLPGGGGHAARAPGDADEGDSAESRSASAVENDDDRSGPEPRTRLGRRARWCTVDTGERFELAGRTHRWLTRIIDIMVFVVLADFVDTIFRALLLLYMEGVVDSYVDRRELVTSLVVLVIAILYEIVWVAREGRNFGKIMLGIRIVRLENAGRPRWGRALARAFIPGVWALWFLVPYAGPLLFLLLFAPIMWQSRRQGLHDKFTATIVVKDGVLSGTRRAITGFLLAIAGLVELRNGAAERDVLIWADAGLAEVVTDFAAALLYGLSCWIGAIVFSRTALRQARHAHWTLRGFALAALGTTLATVILFVLDWRTVFAA